MSALACYRLAALPWQGPLPAGEAPDALGPAPLEASLGSPVYEDWYLVDDYASLGVLNEAAAGRGHRTPHDEIAGLAGPGAGAVYALLEGEPGAPSLGGARSAVWVTTRPRRRARRRSPAVRAWPSCSGTAWTGPPRASGAASWCSAPRPSCAWWRPSLRPVHAEGRLPRGWSSNVVQREPLWSL